MGAYPMQEDLTMKLKRNQPVLVEQNQKEKMMTEIIETQQNKNGTILTAFEFNILAAEKYGD